MTTMILSYRREDTSWIAGRIHDRLRSHYGHDSVFMDIDSIPFGLDFREHIHESLKNCDILLAIIGPDWTAPNEGTRARIFDETDWVRIEIEAALAKKIPVIPVLIDGTHLPPARDLPESVRDIVFRQAADVDAGRDFHPHMDRLIGVMDQLLARQNPVPKPTPRPIEDERKERVLRDNKRAQQETGNRQRPAPREDNEAKSLKWPQKAWNLLASPQGRIGRQRFVIAIIASFVAMHLLNAAVGLPYNEITGHDGMPPIVLVFPLLWIWVVIALAGKRLHDLDWPAWPVAVPLILGIAAPQLLGLPTDLSVRTFLGAAIVIALLLLSPLSFMRGTQGPNRYGPDPLVRHRAPS